METQQLKIFNESEKRAFEKKLNEQFGIETLDGVLAKRGAERIFFFQGSFGSAEIKKIEKIAIIERIGIYFGKEEHDGIRLSIEATQLFKNQIKKNIYELDKEYAERWMMGQDLQIKTGEKGFKIIKYQDDFIGTGKASAEKISNFIPKNRRLKDKSIIK